MKKFLAFIVVLFTTFATALASSSVAQTASKSRQSNSNSVKESVSTLHEDIKGAVSTIHDDASAIASTLYGDGKDAIVSLYPDVKSAVVAIGKAIGVAAEHVYGVLVKKFVVDGIVQLLPFILGIILVVVGWLKLSKYLKETEKIEWRFLYPVLLLAIGIFTLSSVDYNTMVMGLVNPEYGALNYILEYSKTMLK